MEKTATILFQGDSITDASRTIVKEGIMKFIVPDKTISLEEREKRTDTIIGSGYPNLIASRLGYDMPGKYTVINRAISGNRIVDLYQRIKMDFINVKPDIVSIMVGINDVWHELMYKNGVDAVKFEFIYDLLISEIKTALPECRFILVEPFVLKSPANEKDWDYFKTETDLRRAAVKRLSEKYNTLFVPLQQRFDDASVTAPELWWSEDGIHPSAAGHQLIAEEWLNKFHNNK